MVMSTLNELLSDVLALEPNDKLKLIDKILVSLNPSNNGVEAIWKEEAEERIVAYQEGRVSAIDADEVLKKYTKCV